MGLIVPRDFADAVAIAFTAAVEFAIGDDELIASEVGIDTPSSRRRRQDEIARSLGMGRETLRLTVQGERWLRLDEVKRAVVDPLIGVHFRERLRHFGFTQGVIQTTQNSGQTANRGAVMVNMGGTDLTNTETAMAGITEIETRVREDLERLTRLQKIARRRGRKIGSVAWGDIYRQAMDQSVPLPSSGTHQRLRAARVENLSGLVREILEGRAETPTYIIAAEVTRVHPAVSGKQMLDALNRQAAVGKIVRVRRGVYRPLDPEEV